MATETFENTLRDAGLGEGWVWNNGAWWLTTAAGFDLRATTRRLVELQARFAAITAMQIEGGEIRLDYQWDWKGQLLSFTTATSSQTIATIADLVPAAEWAELETHEYFAVEFAGRESTPPLMTRAGDKPGLMLRKEKEAEQ